MRSSLVLALLLGSMLAAPSPAPAQNSAEHKAQLQKDELTLKAHTLTMDELTRFMEAGAAVHQAAKDHPELREYLEKSDNNDDQQTLDQLTAKFSGAPVVVSTLAAHGFTPRQFAIVTMTTVQASMAAFALQRGVKPNDAAFANVNPANIRFVQDHKAEIQALRAKYPQD